MKNSCTRKFLVRKTLPHQHGTARERDGSSCCTEEEERSRSGSGSGSPPPSSSAPWTDGSRDRAEDQDGVSTQSSAAGPWGRSQSQSQSHTGSSSGDRDGTRSSALVDGTGTCASASATCSTGTGRAEDGASWEDALLAVVERRGSRQTLSSIEETRTDGSLPSEIDESGRSRSTQQNGSLRPTPLTLLERAPTPGRFLDYDDGSSLSTFAGPSQSTAGAFRMGPGRLYEPARTMPTTMHQALPADETDELSTSVHSVPHLPHAVAVDDNVVVAVVDDFIDSDDTNNANKHVPSWCPRRWLMRTIAILLVIAVLVIIVTISVETTKKAPSENSNNCEVSGFTDPDKCGGCWCAPSALDGYTCPKVPDDLINDCTPASRRTQLAEIYRSFRLVSSPDYIGRSPIIHNGGYALPDLTEEGELQPCDPYNLGNYTNIPDQSNPHAGLPPCYPQSMHTPYANYADKMVCAFKFRDRAPMDLESCFGREYDLVSYDSEEEAIADGAQVSHGGPCGMCSSAQDLAGWIETEHLRETVRVCYPVGEFSMSFEDFSRCITKALGVSQPCGTHFMAWVNQIPQLVCKEFCKAMQKEIITGNKTIWEVQGPPPACEINTCVQCRRDYTKIGAALAGRDLHFNPGGLYLSSHYYECKLFEYPEVRFDPCDGRI